jgi:DNA invertase Pin-like site-specific DNA recombinase
MEREYIRDRTLEGHEFARKRGKPIGGDGVTDNDMPSMARYRRGQDLSLRDIAVRLVITRARRKDSTHPQRPSRAVRTAGFCSDLRCRVG